MMDKSKSGTRPRTIQSAFHALIGLGVFLVENGILSENPAKLFKLPEKDAAVRHLFRAADVLTISTPASGNVHRGKSP